jgi:hypothetical protein
LISVVKLNLRRLLAGAILGMDQLCFAGWQWQAGLLFSWWNATKKARAVYSGRASAHLFGESSPRTRSSSMMEGGIASYFLPFAPLLEDNKGPGRIGGPLLADLPITRPLIAHHSTD